MLGRVYSPYSDLTQWASHKQRQGKEEVRKQCSVINILQLHMYIMDVTRCFCWFFKVIVNSCLVVGMASKGFSVSGTCLRDFSVSGTNLPWMSGIFVIHTCSPQHHYHGYFLGCAGRCEVMFHISIDISLYGITSLKSEGIWELTRSIAPYLHFGVSNNPCVKCFRGNSQFPTMCMISCAVCLREIFLSDLPAGPSLWSLMPQSIRLESTCDVYPQVPVEL